MKLFRLRSPRSDNERHRTEVGGSHRWHIPWMRCKICRRDLFQVGIAYPAADLSGIPRIERYTQCEYDALSRDEISEMTGNVLSRLPYHLRVTPGTQLGRFKGRVKKPKHDFAWAHSFPFISESALERLRDLGIEDLLVVPPDITYETSPQSHYLELQIEHEANLEGSLRAPRHEPHKRCVACGKDNGLSPSPLVIAAESVPVGINLMRCAQLPGIRLIAEKFASAIRELGLTGVSVETVVVNARRKRPSRVPNHQSDPFAWKGLAGRLQRFQAARPRHQKPKPTQIGIRTPQKLTLSFERMLAGSTLIGLRQELNLLTGRCVRIVTQPTRSKQTLRKENSRLGGIPDLPKDWAWPVHKARPLDFLAQFNLSALQPAAQSIGLPAKGWLYFFYDTNEQPWGDEPQHAGSWRVLYFGGKDSELRKHEPPGSFIEPLPAIALDFIPHWSLPDLGHESVTKLRLSKPESASYERLLTKVRRSWGTRLPMHMIGGFPDTIQSQDMPKECGQMVQLAGLNRKSSTSSEWREWKLLLQLDSDNNAELDWADAGRLYFWIPARDLAQRDFSRVWCILQSH